MNSRRTAKVAEVIREVASTTILFELRDPRIKNVTVTRTEVSPDLRHAKVYVSVMGDERSTKLTMHGLQSSRGYLQSKIADRVKTRYTPLVTFVLDEGIKKSLETSRILDEVLGENREPTQLDDNGELVDSGSDESSDDPVEPNADQPNRESTEHDNDHSTAETPVDDRTGSRQNLASDVEPNPTTQE